MYTMLNGVSQTSNDKLEIICEYDSFTDPVPLFSASPASVIFQLLEHQVRDLVYIPSRSVTVSRGTQSNLFYIYFSTYSNKIIFLIAPISCCQSAVDPPVQFMSLLPVQMRAESCFCCSQEMMNEDRKQKRESQAK